jgi:hypothetical protein
MILLILTLIFLRRLVCMKDSWGWLLIVCFLLFMEFLDLHNPSPRKRL